MNGLSWAALLFALFLALATAVFVVTRLRRRRTRRLARREPRLQFPIVLAHGMFGFDEIELAGRRQVYFRGVPERLKQLGIDCHRPRVPAVASVRSRAESLASAIRSLPVERVNLIAHSMGGLDARYAIVHLGLADKVASLTTIATPHYGTPLAGLGRNVLRRLRWFLEKLIDPRAFEDVTESRMALFNRDVPDIAEVTYLSVVGHSRKRSTNPLLWPSHTYLNQCAGLNDGIVPAKSQRWAEVLMEVNADHWAQIGWSLTFDAPGLYETLARELRGRGF